MLSAAGVSGGSSGGGGGSSSSSSISSSSRIDGSCSAKSGGGEDGRQRSLLSHGKELRKPIRLSQERVSLCKNVRLSCIVTCDV